MRMPVDNVPLEARAEAARALIATGEDPAVMLSCALWPDSAPVFVSQPTISVVEFCSNGHPWDEENTYIRPGTNWRKCRACERELKRTRTRNRKKSPCVFCGAPATPLGYRGSTGLPIVRCRSCFYEQRKERK